jgi:CBS domain-containing protein
MSMNVELQEIRDFIAGIPPFDRLPDEALNRMTHQLSIRYIRRGKAMPPDEAVEPSLYILRQGAVTLLSSEDNLVGMLGEGDVCTSFCMSDTEAEFHIKVTEDTLVYAIPCHVLADIVREHPSVDDFIRHSAAQRLKSAVADQQLEASQTSTLMNTPVEDVMNGGVVSIDIGASIQQAAQTMTDNRVSSILVIKNDLPAGIITDRDMRQRCLAAGLPVETSVSKIMTTGMIHVAPNDMAFDALMTMTRKHIHHLPVIEGEQVQGMITATDLIRHEGRNSVYITSSIRKAENLDALVELSRLVPGLQVQLINMGGSTEHVGNAISAVTSAFTRRLIELAEQDLGPAPVPYAWVAGGSQARREQMSHSDQDNGLIISNDLSEEDEGWFTSLADFVCDGLDACGYVYCPGEAMAKNPKWRQPQRVWKVYFDKWINTPEPMALMLSSIFFDLRVIHGKSKLLKKMRKQVLKKTQSNQLFLAHMTANALHHRTPLGFFRDFVLVHDGQHDDTLDLKHNGLVPIIDMARIYALAEGITAVNTVERIEKAAGSRTLSETGAANLLDAFEFIGKLRMQHQAKRIRNGEGADNFILPTDMSRLEREHLKDAFKVIQTMQAVLEQRYMAGRVG